MSDVLEPSSFLLQDKNSKWYVISGQHFDPDCGRCMVGTDPSHRCVLYGSRNMRALMVFD